MATIIYTDFFFTLAFDYVDCVLGIVSSWFTAVDLVVLML